MLNRIIVMGRLTRNPDVRKTAQGTSVTGFTLAVDRDYGAKDGGEKKTDFIDCTAWRQTADFVGRYFSKGSMAVVEGRLQINDWTDNMGNRRSSAEIVAERVYFGESKRANAGSEQPRAQEPVNVSTEFGGFEELDDNSLLPF